MRRRIANNVADMHISPAPPCFETRSAWEQYVLNAAKAKPNNVYKIHDGTPIMRQDFDFCRDCNTPHQMRMAQQGRCNKVTKTALLDEKIIKAAHGKTARQIEDTPEVETARQAAKVSVRARIEHLTRTGALVKIDWGRYAVTKKDLIF